MSDALKSNTTLTELDLRGEDKTNNTQMISTNNPLIHSHRVNRKRYWRRRSNIIELCIEIKHNTH